MSENAPRSQTNKGNENILVQGNKNVVTQFKKYFAFVMLNQSFPKLSEEVERKGRKSFLDQLNFLYTKTLNQFLLGVTPIPLEGHISPDLTMLHKRYANN